VDIARTPLPRRPGVALSALAFGGAPIGNLYRAISDEQAHAAVDAAWTAGIRYFDTAPHYGVGLSERRLGAVLAGRPREELVVSTKVGRLLVPSPETAGQRDGEGFDVPADPRRVRDYSADGVRRSLEASLERLGLDRVDVVLVHDPDDHYDEASREAVPALCALREEGVIGAVGVGMNDSGMLARFVAETDVDVVMCAGRYSLLEQPALGDLMPLATERRVGVIAVGVFNSGLLARADVPDDATYDYAPAPAPVLDRARRLAAACREHGTTLPAAALHLALSHPAVVAVGLGMAGPEQVREDVALLAAPPPASLWADLVDRGLLDPAVPT
jgi:D-threo-aldose 1-dehydrogenase